MNLRASPDSVSGFCLYWTYLDCESLILLVCKIILFFCATLRCRNFPAKKRSLRESKRCWPIYEPFELIKSVLCLKTEYIMFDSVLEIFWQQIKRYIRSIFYSWKQCKRPLKLEITTLLEKTARVNYVYAVESKFLEPFFFEPSENWNQKVVPLPSVERRGFSIRRTDSSKFSFP